MENNGKNPRLDFETAKIIAKMLGFDVSDEEIRERVTISRWASDNFKALSIMYRQACLELKREPNDKDFVAFANAAYGKYKDTTLMVGEKSIVVIPQSKSN